MPDPFITVTTKSAPPPFGHYGQGTVCNGMIFVSGQLGAHADGSHGFDDPFETQVKQCLKNLMAIVESAGGSKETIVNVTAYIVDTKNWEAFNGFYAEVFGDTRPARAVVPVPDLHHGYLIELTAVATVL